jgi:Reverse transcriptase (RNA-dependent DNA polymerase)/Group II intron, maturase-specific domain
MNSHAKAALSKPSVSRRAVASRSASMRSTTAASPSRQPSVDSASRPDLPKRARLRARMSCSCACLLRTNRRSSSVDWTIFCSASKVATSKPTNSLSLPDASATRSLPTAAGPSSPDRPPGGYAQRSTVNPPRHKSYKPTLRITQRCSYGGVISPCLCNVYLHRLDRQWAARGHGTLLRYADDLLAICKTKRDAENAVAALTVILAEMGLELKSAKTRIVHLVQGGEGVDFLGFHDRYVRGNTPRSRHLTFLVRWPSRQAMGHARQRIREITARSRLRVPVEIIVRDLNRFLRGWAG